MAARPHLSLPLDLAHNLLNGKKIKLRAPDLRVEPIVRIAEADADGSSPEMVIPLPESVAEFVRAAPEEKPPAYLPLTQEVLDALNLSEPDGIYILDLAKLASRRSLAMPVS